MDRDLTNMRIAVVHDWLVTYGGAERVLEEILKLFPHADLFSLVDGLAEDEREFIGHRKVTTTFLQRFPNVARHYRKYLPFMPYAIEQLDLSDYDLVISSSHAVAKGVLTYGDQTHISYFNGIMNYAWGLYHFYLKDGGLTSGLKGLFAKLMLHRVRIWDACTANRVDHYIANSGHMARNIRRIYGKPSTIIHPPVDTEKFTFCDDKDDYYVAVARLVPIKRIDLIVEAFKQMPTKRLVVLGDGPEMDRIKALAGDNVELLGNSPQATVARYMANAKALITASVEPFGIASVEAQACGTPVIAFGRGGALETILENQTGVFFLRQQAEDIVDAVERFDRISGGFDPHAIREQALQFSKESFRRKFMAFVESALADEDRRNTLRLTRPPESSKWITARTNRLTVTSSLREESLVEK